MSDNAKNVLTFDIIVISRSKRILSNFTNSFCKFSVDNINYNSK